MKLDSLVASMSKDKIMANMHVIAGNGFQTEHHDEKADKDAENKDTEEETEADAEEEMEEATAENEDNGPERQE